MGEEKKIKSVEDVQSFYDETTKNVSELKEAVKAVPDLEQKVGAIQKGLETINLFFKSNWRQGDSKEGKSYQFGRLVSALYQAVVNKVHKAHEDLVEMGCVPNKAAGKDADWKEVGDWSFGGSEKAALGTVLRGDTTTGSYLIPREYAAEVMRVAATNSKMMGQVRSIPMGVRKLTIPTAATMASFAWPTNEATAKTEVNPTFGYKDLDVKTAAGWITITEELNEDSLVPLGDYFRDIFGEAWALEFDKQCLNSNAAPFTGVLHDGSVNVVTMGNGNTTFQDVTADDCLNMISALTTENKRMGAKFIMNPTILDQVRKLKDAQGNYIYQRPYEGAPGSLWGYPIIECSSMPTLTASAISTAFIAFGNPRYILHGDRIGMEFKIFDQTSQAVDYDQIFFRCRLRQAFVVGIPAAFSRLRTSAT